MLNENIVKTQEELGALDQLSEKINKKKDTLYAIDVIQQFEESFDRNIHKNNSREEME